METSGSFSTTDLNKGNVLNDNERIDPTEVLADYYIECLDLFKIFKRADLEVVALRGIDFEVKHGEMV